MESTEQKTKKSRRFINITYISLTLILVILYFLPSPGRNLFADFSDIISSFNPNISAEKNQAFEPFKYVNDAESNHCLITGIGTYSEATLDIPQRIGRYTVTGIGSNAFFRQYDFITVNIHGLVETIGSNAFAECKRLEAVNIKNGVMNIENYAFYGCYSLRTINIPVSVDHIGKDVFLDCHSLTDIYFDGSMEKWNVLSAVSSWNLNKRCTVHCLDGDIFANDIENIENGTDKNGDGIIDENDSM